MHANDWRASSYIAYKSIVRGNRSTTVLMVLILTLSFINMLFISGLMNGFGGMIPQMFINDVSSDIAISPQEKPDVKQFISNQTYLRSQIATIPGVLGTTRRYSLAGSVAFDKDKSGLYKSLSAGIVGVDPAKDSQIMGDYAVMRAGVFLTDSDTDQIVMSSALAGGYGDVAPSDLGGVKVGDKVQVTYSNGFVREYTVKGIYRDNMNILASYITSREAESVLGTYDSASKILVKVDLERQPLAGYVQDVKMLGPNLKVQTYEDTLGGYAGIFRAINLVALIVSVISVLVAAVTIFILIYVNALNKRRQIGIFRAIGVKQSIIIYSYAMQALFYVLVSVVLGSLVVFGALYPYFSAHPINADIGFISLLFTAPGIASSVASFIIAGMLSGYIPSRIVARQDIISAIWY